MRLKQRNPPEQNRSIDGCSLTAVNKKTPWDSKRNPAEFFYFCHFSCSRCLFVCISLPHYEIDKVNRIQQQHDQPVFSCEHLLFRTEEVPVSYTHLDVYKRQGYLFPDELISVVFAQDAAELSLEKAVEIMQTEGLQAESAQLARESDKAIAQGYKETAKTISDSLDIADLLPLDQQYQLQESGVTKSNLKITQLQRDFVKENIDNNYQADMNKIEQTTEQLYFGLLQAQENVKVCEETLISEENTLNLLKKKYELGAASKLEVQSHCSEA